MKQPPDGFDDLVKRMGSIFAARRASDTRANQTKKFNGAGPPPLKRLVTGVRKPAHRPALDWRIIYDGDGVDLPNSAKGDPLAQLLDWPPGSCPAGLEERVSEWADLRYGWENRRTTPLGTAFETTWEGVELLRELLLEVRGKWPWRTVATRRLGVAIKNQSRNASGFVELRLDDPT